MKANARLTAAAGQIHWRAQAPVSLRQTGPGQVHLVQAAGGPLGGDQWALAVSVADRGDLQICSAGATVALPGPSGEPARWAVTAAVGPASRLRWLPQPTVVAAGARLHSSLQVDLAPDAVFLAREQVVLGRSGEVGGAFRGDLVVCVGGRPLIVHEVLLDGADPELSGPAGSGGYRVFGSLLAAAPALGEHRPDLQQCGEAPGVRWAVLPLAGPGVLLLVLGDTATSVDAILDRGERTLRGCLG